MGSLSLSDVFYILYLLIYISYIKVFVLFKLKIET